MCAQVPIPPIQGSERDILHPLPHPSNRTWSRAACWFGVLALPGTGIVSGVACALREREASFLPPSRRPFGGDSRAEFGAWTSLTRGSLVHARHVYYIYTVVKSWARKLQSLCSAACTGIGHARPQAAPFRGRLTTPPRAALAQSKCPGINAFRVKCPLHTCRKPSS